MAALYETHTLDIPMAEVVNALRERYSVLPREIDAELHVEIVPPTSDAAPKHQNLRLKWSSKKDAQPNPITRSG